MKFTEHYRLTSFDVGEKVNALEDSRRFLTIDRQLLGLFEVLGNGVIEGWDLGYNQNGLNLSVSPGRGHINYMSAITTDPQPISGIVPNQVNYIYARGSEDMRFTRTPNFFADIVLYQNNPNLIILGKVTAGATSFVSIDQSLRTDISFIETIKSLIEQHKHIGGLDSPSRINLGSEVFGKLPGYRVDGLDASKIITGKINPSRLPVIDHNDLLNNGILTHSQLDTFVKNLSNENARLLGELSTINMMQLYLATKHIWNEIDLYTSNMLVVIPGISSSTITDTTATTATVDLVNHTIQGVPALDGSLHQKYYNTKYDFDKFQVLKNLDFIATNTGTAIVLTKPSTSTEIEGFDSVDPTTLDVPGWTIETVAINSSSELKGDSFVTSDDGSTYSGRLLIQQGMRFQITKLFDTPLPDWTSYNELSLLVRVDQESHPEVHLQILGEYDQTLKEYPILKETVLLAANEIPQKNIDGKGSGFKPVITDITTITRTAIGGIRIYTDTSLGWEVGTQFQLYIDNIKVVNSQFFQPSGYIRFRIQTPQISQWSSISWDADLNDGQISMRARSAPNFAVFDQSASIPFSDPIYISDSSPNVQDNTNFEFEIILTSSTAKTASPLLRSITVSYITQSTEQGLSISSVDGFLRAKRLLNATVQTRTGVIDASNRPGGKVVIDGRVDAGDYIYGTSFAGHGTVQQVVPNTTTGGTSTFGIVGATLPQSPIQATAISLATNDAEQALISGKNGLEAVAHVKKLPDRTYLVCDTPNDRVLLFDDKENVITGMQTNNIALPKLFPIGAIFNQTNNTLYLAWSNQVRQSTFVVSQITIIASSLQIPLSPLMETVIIEGGSSNVVKIKLSDLRAGEVNTYLNNSTGNNELFLRIGTDVISTGFDTQNINYAALLDMRGLPVYIGNIKYVSGIFHPISVEETSLGNWLIANAKPLLAKDLLTGVTRDSIHSVLEADPVTGETLFSDDSVDFSTITLGSAIEYDDENILVAGIVPLEQITDVSTGSDTVDNNIPAVEPTTTTEFTELAKYQGRIRIVNRQSGKTIFDQLVSDGSYAADVQLDNDNNIVFIEKAFSSTNGISATSRVLKMDADGNIFFQYGMGESASYNDVRVLSNNHLVLSS